MNTKTTTLALIGAVALTLGSTACSKKSDEGSPAAAKAGGEEGATQPASAGGAVSCRQVGIGNYFATFSGCSDNVTWAMLCREGGGEFKCTCKKGDEELKVETVTEEPYSLKLMGKPELKKQAAAAANRICGFNLSFAG